VRPPPARDATKKEVRRRLRRRVFMSDRDSGSYSDGATVAGSGEWVKNITLDGYQSFDVLSRLGASQWGEAIYGVRTSPRSTALDIVIHWITIKLCKQ